MSSGNISSLEFLAQNDQTMFKDVLLTSSYSPFKEISHQDFKDKYQAIISTEAITKGLKELFNLCLLTNFLLKEEGGQPSWAESFLTDNVDVKKYLGLNLGSAKMGSWCSVPVIFTGNNTADIRLFIIGLLDERLEYDTVPEWAQSILSDTLLKAVETAKQVAEGFAHPRGNKSLLCFPFAIPGETVQFKGVSLGLPLALGFTRILTARPVTTKLVATGGIEPDGTITKVGHLGKKITEAQLRFDGLLYPFTNNVVRKEKKSILIPVSNFKQAWMFFSLYSEKDKDKLSLLSNIIKDPKLFAENIGNLPAEWIAWIQNERSIDGTLYKVINNPSLFFIFTSNFEKTVDRYLLEKGKAIGKLIKQNVLDQLSKSSPVAALKWCSANLSLANHLGCIKNASKWKNYGMGLTKKVLQADIEIVVTFYNHALVFNHNRFFFHKDLSDELTRLLEFLESQYKQKCDFGCSTDLLTGRFYGTIMQNVAFCGPGYIEESEKLSQKARKALGKGTTPEFTDEWTRHLSYITFARLDAGNFTKAEESLKAYLEIDILENTLIQPVELDPWGYALLARFFCQVKDHPLGEKFYKWIESKFNTIKMDVHPWQLFAYNTGQMAYSLGHIDEAIKMMLKSIDICLSDQLGPTVHVMSLLPISLLAYYMKEAKRTFKVDFPRWEKDIRTSAEKLDADHFSFLKESDFQKILEEVRICPERFFPFTYR